MSKKVDAGSFADALSELVRDGVDELLCDAPATVECPECGTAFAVDASTSECPGCGLPVTVVAG